MTSTTLAPATAAYSSPSRAYRDGKHVGPGAWLSLVRAVNTLDSSTPFGSPTTFGNREDAGGKYVETYGDRFTVTIDADEYGRTTVAAHTSADAELLRRAAATVEGLTIDGDGGKVTMIWELSPADVTRLMADLADADANGRMVRVSADWGTFKWKIGEDGWTPPVGTRTK